MPAGNIYVELTEDGNTMLGLMKEHSALTGSGDFKDFEKRIRNT
jgi:hypothetical protein